MAGAIDYLCAELVGLAAEECENDHKKRLFPRHISLAILKDNELTKLFGRSVIADGAVLQKVHPSLLP